MANLNLSEFTEKTFVADADWTFVWDTAGLISKKVSRNSLLNSGTLTTSAPVTISQTWNDAAVEFTAFKVNAVSTASASASLLLDLQVGGVSYVKIGKNGLISVADSVGSGGFVFRPGNTGSGGIGNLSGGGYGVWAGAASAIGFSTGAALVGSIQTALYTDGAGQLALRNGAAAQTFNIYNTYQNAGVDYERITFKWSANLFLIGREFGGTGVARNIRVVGGGSVIGIGEAASAAVDWTFANGTLLAGTDNSKDIGASGANRPRNIYAAGFLQAGATGSIGFANRSYLKSASDGVMQLVNTAETDFNRLQFGGTTASFPALKRSTTSLQARLADDSAFTNIQGKLTTDTAYTGTTVVPTGFITLYDSTGTAYKVPCVAA